MAKRKMKKTEVIREILSDLGPEVRNKDVIAVLASRRIKVTSAHISNVKAAQNKSKYSTNGLPPRLDHPLSFELLRQGKILLDLAKTVEEAKRVLDVLQHLR
jgi:hypothetical protein